MSSQSSPHLRSRSELESDEEAEEVRASQRSTSKRARTNGYRSEGQSESPEPAAFTTIHRRGRRENLYDEEDGINGEDSGPGEFQPGAIVRVKLTNFVTYENAEFFPGPNLNMVIGPNGTGKSSLVCAICLGLGWGPQYLGRAGQVGEFVKHNTNDAQVEIELQRRPEEPENHVVRLRIIKDGNQREFWLNGKKTSLKAVQALTKSLSIQIDNLCQFLPQDKVSEFAALSPVELLQHTQRAAAPEYMLEWHEDLKKLRKEEKAFRTQQTTDQAHLENLETRQQNLQAEVDRLQERNKIEDRVKFLRYAIPMVEYRVAVDKHKECKAKKQQAQANLRALEERIAPTLLSITEKKAYKDEIEAVLKERDTHVKESEQVANRGFANISKLEIEGQEHETAINRLKQVQKERRQQVINQSKKIRDFKARYEQAPIEFNNTEWNDLIKAKKLEIRSNENQFREADAGYDELKVQGRAIRDRQDTAEQDLADFNSQEGQQMNKLEKISKDTAKAWKWIQEHMSEFREEIYPPPIISCSIKDRRYVDAVESLLHKGDVLSITAQNLDDMKKLSDQVHDVMGLADVTVRTSKDTPPSTRPLSPDELNVYGMDGWAIDFIDGPGTVLAMLCSSSKLERCAVALRDISDDQYNLITREKKLSRWVTNQHSYQVISRQEYGPNAVSTITRGVRPAQYWVDQQLDLSARNEIQARIDAARAEMEEMKKEAIRLQKTKTNLKRIIDDLKQEVVKIEADKAQLQKAYNERAALPRKIEREEQLILQIKGEIQATAGEIKQTHANLDDTAVRRAKEALNYKEQVAQLRLCHEELIEAQIRLIEAESDVVGLEARNRDIVQQQVEERERVRTIERESKEVKDAAKAAFDTVQRLFSDPDIEAMKEELTNYSNGNNVEAIDIEIASEKSKLEYIHANNPNAIRDFERRQGEIDALTAKIETATEKLQRIAHKITKTRDKWEPQLDELVAQISEAFSFNFEQIGCAGEVSVHKDEDFDQWSIQIKVKFRENETLQLLDQHRQSGGERSVSTIFYLMSLQSLARAPFRVVDEINQGMDPRNERMVHERMVEIACQEYTSQYFLITPKLLTGLRYDKRMKVLCIASGEHMPDNYKRLDISKIIGIQRAIMAAG